MNKKTKMNLKSKIAGIMALSLVVQIILPVLPIPGISEDASVAKAQELCVVDVDVVLLMDTSGSMANGEALSVCEWSEIKPYGGGSTWFLNKKYDTTEEWCQNIKDSFDESNPIFQFVATNYTPAKNAKITDAKASANSFIDNMGQNDQSAIAFFNDIADLAKQLSNNHQATKDEINGLIPEGATNIGDAIAEGITELGSARANPQATKAMILLTDGKTNKPNGPGYGEDPADVAYAEAKALEAAGSGYKIFTIGLGSGSDINETMLGNIANITGASYYHANNGEDLSGIYDQIAFEVCQYSSISGCKYIDSDNNGDISGEQTEEGWDIILGGDASSTQATDQEGCYTFAGLESGNYTVVEGVNIGKTPFTQTYPQTPYNIALAKGHNEADVDFGNYQPYCGNTIVDNVEQCDDGNTDDGDGCSAICEVEVPDPVCGDGTVDAGEQCDDSNTDDGDGCSSICENEEEPPPGIQPGDIVINEIMQNPSAVFDSKGEWVELYNASSTDLELSGCVIHDNGGDTHTILGSLIAFAQDYIVLAINGTSAENGGVDDDYVYSGIILSNYGDEIILECNGMEIDRVEYDGGPLFPNPTGVSMILSDFALDNNVGANWCTSTSPYGAGDLGTPGFLNDVCGGEPPATVCGDGTVNQPTEECDGTDGVLEHYTCTQQCTLEYVPYCGDNVQDPGEQCDDGNNTDGDDCSAICEIEDGPPPETGAITVCKMIIDEENNIINGTTSPGTFIVPSGTSSQPLATSTFSTPLALNTDLLGDDSINDAQCIVYDNLDLATYYYGQEQVTGDNWQEPLYNDQSDTDVTSTDSFYSFDINNSDSDGMINLLLKGPNRTLVVLNRFLTPPVDPVCGNGQTESPEQCDDGNVAGGDGCSEICENEDSGPGPGPGPDPVCGDGTVDAGEQCDDSNTDDGDGCSAICENEDSGPGPSPAAYCGNGIVEEPEQCDDSNTDNGDGCSEACKNEDPSGTPLPYNPAPLPFQGVAGASTGQTGTSPQQGGECVPYLTEYLKIGEDNSPEEVVKLQKFLRDFEGFTELAVTGIFNQDTFDAVFDFQLKYKEDILDPWGIDFATGFVYITTKNKINELYCGKEYSLTPEEQATIDAVTSLLQQNLLTPQELSPVIGQAPQTPQGTTPTPLLSNIAEQVDPEEEQKKIETKKEARAVISAIEEALAALILLFD